MCYHLVSLKYGGRSSAWDVVESGCRVRWGKINAGMHRCMGWCIQIATPVRRCYIAIYHYNMEHGVLKTASDYRAVCFTLDEILFAFDESRLTSRFLVTLQFVSMKTTMKLWSY